MLFYTLMSKLFKKQLENNNTDLLIEDVKILILEFLVGEKFYIRGTKAYWNYLLKIYNIPIYRTCNTYYTFHDDDDDDDQYDDDQYDDDQYDDDQYDDDQYDDDQDDYTFHWYGMRKTNKYNMYLYHPVENLIKANYIFNYEKKKSLELDNIKPKILTFDIYSIEYDMTVDVIREQKKYDAKRQHKIFNMEKKSKAKQKKDMEKKKRKQLNYNRMVKYNCHEGRGNIEKFAQFSRIECARQRLFPSKPRICFS